MSSVCFIVTGGDADLTAEAVQSAWPIAWRKMKTIREPERLRPWLISIAVNEARLKPEDRELIALRYVAGFDSTELARATGMSPSGTRARLARLLGRLRSELGDG